MSARWLDDDDDPPPKEKASRIRKRGKNLERPDQPPQEDDDDFDVDLPPLSHVGRAVYDCLNQYHHPYRRALWNVSTGAVVGPFHQTPVRAFADFSGSADPNQAAGHDDWFAVALGDLLARTEYFADVLSLREPDGRFLEEFRRAVTALARKQQPVVVRLMLGNVVAWPIDCERVVRDLTRDIPTADSNNNNLRLWVGAWRHTFSWNHAKMIAVDGQRIHTGGHNLWSQHYLQNNPLHDVSLELEGRGVAEDGHRFANQQWAFVDEEDTLKQQSFLRRIPFQTLVSVASFPPSSSTSTTPRYPPMYRPNVVPDSVRQAAAAAVTSPRHQQVPVLTLGKCGRLVDHDRPSDDALVALLASAQNRIRLALQDLGPRCVPITDYGINIQYPGYDWPHETLRALAIALWDRRVSVDIVVSNKGAYCGGLVGDSLARPNGWTVQQVYDKIVAAVHTEFPETITCRSTTRRTTMAAEDDVPPPPSKVIAEHLRVCGLKHRTGDAYEDGTKLGMHTKVFIVDDAFYCGSQNLYVCDLAEWGVIVDDKETTQRLLQEYWDPMWDCSWRPCDATAAEGYI